MGLFLICCSALGNADIAYATNRAWFDNTINSNITQMMVYQDSPCSNKVVNIYDYNLNKVISSTKCVRRESWGSVSSDGYIRVAAEPEHKPYYKVESLENIEVIFTSSTETLYFSQPARPGYLRLGSLSNPSSRLSLNTITNKYNFHQSLFFFPEVFSLIGFSENSESMVGITDKNTFVSLNTWSSQKTAIPVSAFKFTPANYDKIAISSDGSLVLAANNMSVDLYDLGGCKASNREFCQARNLTNSLNMNEVGRLEIEAQRSYVVVRSNPSDRLATSAAFYPVVPQRTVSYAALGDSFSSGEGSWDYKEGTDGNKNYPDEKCHQSYEISYPAFYDVFYRRSYLDLDVTGYVPDKTEGMRTREFVFAACSGATTKDIKGEGGYETEYPGQFGQFKNYSRIQDKTYARNQAVENQIPGRALQRDFLARYKPTFATVGIGGNDVGFYDTLVSCIYSIGTCREASSDLYKSGTRIRSAFDTLADTYRNLHKASPATRLYAVGYPIIVKGEDVAFCSFFTLLNRKERSLVKEGTKYLNDVIEAAAKKAGIGYIDIEDALGEGVMCGSHERAVNHLLTGGDVGIPGTPIKIFAQESFHPNSRGHLLVGLRIIERYGELDNYPNKNCPTKSDGYCPDESVRAPAIPAYFRTGNKKLPDRVEYKSDMAQPVTTKNILNVVIDGLKKLSFLKGVIFSEPQSLGTFQVREDGKFDRAIKLPDNLEPGYHTIYFTGTLANGETFEYSQVILYLPPGTKTGPCGIFPYSNIDQDQDGIDDACDPSVDVDEPLKVEDPSTILIYPNQGNTSAGSGNNQLGDVKSQSTTASRSARTDPAAAAIASALQLSDEVGGQLSGQEGNSSSSQAESGDFEKSGRSWGLMAALIALGAGAAVSVFAVYNRFKRRTREP